MLTDEQVLVPTNSGTLYAVDRTTGHLVARFDSGQSLLRGLADGGDVFVAVAGFEDAGLLAVGEDPAGTLIDEPSPTTLDVGALLAGFALGALPVGIVAVVLTRPLQRRLTGSSGPESGPVDVVEDGDR